jgi:hypothetical protein
LHVDEKLALPVILGEAEGIGQARLNLDIEPILDCSLAGRIVEILFPFAALDIVKKHVQQVFRRDSNEYIGYNEEFIAIAQILTAFAAYVKAIYLILHVALLQFEPRRLT